MIDSNSKTDNPNIPPFGIEWIIDASGCCADRLRDLAIVRRVCERVLFDLDLKVVGEPQWHQFSGAAGVTGLYLLSESHLACHTYPEHQFASFNLYCCRAKPDWPWENGLRTALLASSISIRQAKRGLDAACLADSVEAAR
ncbi:MAG: S-adenosylmethionine decarboxylase [Planctomycetales bacterium]|nr:S-adenosylmethionine decarboxylase [Planctomycetales bacterium]